ncbi:MAG: NAD-dependent protein deacylase, partial [Candidatus Aminicenantes bacterium]|nr:NAD-dependent protein deacylase [Candidatus Aminicenantes bacterium]
ISENIETPLKNIPPSCPKCGALLRPHIVWFGESLDPAILHNAFLLSSGCEVMFVIGTSAVVQPAASLPLSAAEAGAKVVEINLDPTPLTSYADFSFRGKAGDILPLIDEEL